MAPTGPQKPLFDVAAEIPVKIISGGDLACVVKYPTDQQWIERAAKQRLIKRNLGRGASEFDSPNTAEGDSILFDQIRIDSDGPEFAGADRSTVIDKLERCRIVESARAGNEYRIEATPLGMRTIHTLRIPTQADILEYSRSAVKSRDMRRHQEIRVCLEPASVLYNKLLVKAEGYAGAVPITHKSSVISELVREIESASEEDESF
jgi:hypothetical protein